MTQTLPSTVKWNSKDLELLAADEWKRYEIIDGELFVTRAPHVGHQDSAGRIYARLLYWSDETQLGKPLFSPGLIFSDADNVIPDVAWVSSARLPELTDEEGHLTGAPDLVVEVLSLGMQNERRDREAKLKLYSIKGVQEYWIVDWRLKQIEIYQRRDTQLQLIKTLCAADEISSPLLPGFCCKVERFF
jgi:Uma2 family endonuclease